MVGGDDRAAQGRATFVAQAMSSVNLSAYACTNPHASSLIERHGSMHTVV